MSKTKIFVSSTCFDLSQVREDIREGLFNLGHDPILSEYDSFSVIPDLNNVDNCRRNVRENTDIFILIIGGRRGTIDRETEKSIVNIEYDAAKDVGIDSLIFVKQEILNLIPVWEKNPDADFSTYVDHTAVFSFIKKIQSEQKWIFSYSKSSDILSIIKTQLSGYLKYLVNKKREGKLVPIQEFKNETLKAQNFVLNKLDNWEYLLTAELLESRMINYGEVLDNIKKGLVFKKTVFVSGNNYFLNVLQSKMGDIANLIEYFHKCIFEELAGAWGNSEQSGDPIKIKKAVELIGKGCQEVIDWELEMRSIVPPEKFQKIRKLLFGAAESLFSDIKDIPRKLIESITRENIEQGNSIKIYIEIRPFENLPLLHEEILKLREDPEFMFEIAHGQN